MPGAKVYHKNGQWSNASEDRVNIACYNPSWPQMFDDEIAAFRQAFPEGIEWRALHVGSTAVPGMAAKPIIDIALLVPNRDAWKSFVDPLNSLGYVFWADNPKSNRMFFVKGMPPYGRSRTHHVHIRDQDDIEDLVTFRDYLRTYPQEAACYESLKQELARRYETDRDAYTAAKGKYIDKVLIPARRLQ